MLEISENILRQNYTIIINKKKNENSIQGIYVNSFNKEIKQHRLPESELKVIRLLPNIMEYLRIGALLQVQISGYSINAILGREEKQGLCSEGSNLEVIEQLDRENYHELLVDLDMKLATNIEQHNREFVKKYRKLYKGEKYE